MKPAMSTGETICNYADEWVPKALLERARRKQSNPIFILISGPQGSGKSYNTAVLHEHLKRNYNCLSVSIDDFYLTYEEQCRLNDRYKTNNLLKGRGLPGTHDMKLLKLFLELLKAADGVINIPQYDKSAYGGKGDRSKTVVQAKLPVDIVIIEGWFLGFQPVTDDELEARAEKGIVNPLKEVNRLLGTYAELLWNNSQLITLGITFVTSNLDYVRIWRLEQEHELISKTGNGMTDGQVAIFLQRYFHCYKVYYEQFVSSRSLGNFHNIVIGLSLRRTIKYVL